MLEAVFCLITRNSQPYSAVFDDCGGEEGLYRNESTSKADTLAFWKPEQNNVLFSKDLCKISKKLETWL